MDHFLSQSAPENKRPPRHVAVKGAFSGASRANIREVSGLYFPEYELHFCECGLLH